MIKVGIVGATGYAGQELVRLLYGHPEVKIIKTISETYNDNKYSYIYRNFTGLSQDICSALDYETIADGIDVLFTSLPYGVLMEKLNEDILNNVKVIDLGVDYRLMNSAEYKQYYGKEHKSINLSSRFTYGLSEWNENEIQDAENIANPGCFATAIELALLPLIKEKIISTEVTVDGKCALSGSGRTLTIGTHFAEANESVKPYKITNHPHKIETQKAIEYFTNELVRLTFVPHIVPMQRGILVTCYTKPTAKIDRDFIGNIYQKYYNGKPFVQILDRGMYVETKWVRNSNMCHINFEVDEQDNSLIVFAAIDNLIKGAAGQAVQNLNIMNGFPQNMSINYVPACI
ncbi:N-acetyl-gamma-glutamyl-phosphate reductase [Sedimentibacter sp.]|uniref:N-acetyl-gamma-glutamyl-phosphate reductase n=1 Tax=Sedimentibacter sp. TaxID=1960295 RepID=UPI000EBC6431|nr:N-acetyl-gamma-glutamyl-phosphate reductase [Sedimentibacter sp.]HCX63172.1 N-acetyl-gamma-glutamyl-phosphate reductase [Clostridiales bacterium]